MSCLGVVPSFEFAIFISLSPIEMQSMFLLQLNMLYDVYLVELQLLQLAWLLFLFCAQVDVATFESRL